MATSERSDPAWKLAALVFGSSTVFLAIILAGQLATPRFVYGPDEVNVQPSDTTTPEAEIETPVVSEVSARVGELGLVIMQNYSLDRGWPADVTVTNGTATTAEDVILGDIPISWILTYALAEDGSGFTLTLEDEDGQSAVFGPAAINP